ncbi:MAG TPA: hypothetical protein VNN73_20325 [Blastocatellia bacterium]|nr:hypothetical protein [Blastocatellia bacterium]
MLKKALSLALIGLLFHILLCVRPASAGTKMDKQSQFAEKVKAGIAKLGVGKDAKVVIKL